MSRRRPPAGPAITLTTAAVTAALVLGACGGGSGGEDGNARGGDATVSPTSVPATTSVDITGRVKTYVVSSRQHVAGTVNYAQKPPVGGDHAPAWQTCGFYSEPVPTERAVHSLEHGAVWITYRPGLPDAQVADLRALTRGNSYVLVSPWADASLPAPVVASAWGVQLTAETAADPGLGAFVRKYANGPQSPEPGAPCTGGLGTPG